MYVCMYVCMYVSLKRVPCPKTVGEIVQTGTKAPKGGELALSLLSTKGPKKAMGKLCNGNEGYTGILGGCGRDILLGV